MSFLAPLFLLGAFSLALPVVFHLLRRTARERTLFSSLMFLRPSPPRFTRRRRFEHLLLLALRCAALCLLALGFARPFMRQAVLPLPTQVSNQEVLVLVDTSASMRRAGLWDSARDLALAVVRQSELNDQIGIYGFDQQLRPLLTFADWNRAPIAERAALAGSRLNACSPSWFATDLGAAVTAAAELLPERDAQSAAPAPIRRIVLISDLQEGSRVDLLRSYHWPKGIELVIQTVAAKPAGNASLQRISDHSITADTNGPSVRVRVSNSANGSRDNFQVGWVRSDNSSWLGNPREVYVPAGQSRVLDLPMATNQTTETIMLRGDEADFDNRFYVAKSEPGHRIVVYLGDDAEADNRQPAFFMRHALRETPRTIVTLSVLSSRQPMTEDQLNAAALIVVSDSVSETAVSALRRQIANGKTVWFVPKNAAAVATLAATLGRAQIGCEEIRPPTYVLWAEMDWGHPVLAPFADPRFSDFTKIHFWRYRRLALADLPEARVLIRFDTGDAALVEIPAGRGRVMVMTAGWNPEDSQLALSSKFVPLLYAMVELGSGQSEESEQHYVGELLTLASPARSTSAPGSMLLPDGKKVEVPAGATNFTETVQPGIYQYAAGDLSQRFAVNLAPSESRTVPMAIEELERLGPPKMPHQNREVRERSRLEHPQAVQLEGQQKLWRWFLFLALAVLIVESWLAGWTTRRAPAIGFAGEAPTPTTSPEV
jgi:hypothetical protein